MNSYKPYEKTIMSSSQQMQLTDQLMPWTQQMQKTDQLMPLNSADVVSRWTEAVKLKTELNLGS